MSSNNPEKTDTDSHAGEAREWDEAISSLIAFEGIERADAILAQTVVAHIVLRTLFRIRKNVMRIHQLGKPFRVAALTVVGMVTIG